MKDLKTSELIVWLTELEMKRNASSDDVTNIKKIKSELKLRKSE